MTPDELRGIAPDVRVGFILTREGRAWSEEGMLAMTDFANEQYPPETRDIANGGILWHAGYSLNTPEFLAKLLDVRPDAFIVLSLPERSVLLGGPKMGTASIRDYLRAYPEESSWKLLASVWTSIENERRG